MGFHGPPDKFVEAKTKYGQPPAPSIPLMKRFAPETWMPANDGGASATTKSVPEVLSKFVFQSKPSGKSGRMTFVNEPERFGVMNNLKLSPAAKSPAPTLVM